MTQGEKYAGGPLGTSKNPDLVNPVGIFVFNAPDNLKFMGCFLLGSMRTLCQIISYFRVRTKFMIMRSSGLLALLMFAVSSISVLAQNDSLILNNGNVIVGEIKGMNKGVLQIETDYSDADFTIELDGIKEMYSNSRFLFTTSDGSRYTGSFKTANDSTIIIVDDDKGEITVHLNDIVYLNSLDQGFLSRLYANIDVGYSLAKANNQQQLNVNFRMGYLADLWSLDGYYNSLFSTQTDVADIRRNDGGVEYKYFLPHDWYLNAELSFLSNTEQNLDLRTTGKIGAGNYVIHTNAAYWGFGAGVAYNNERFGTVTEGDSTYQPDGRQSYEGYIGTELNMYDVGDLNLFTKLTAYPSFTESGRWRADFRFDAKYDDFLLEDFYIRAGFTLNYDNQPAGFDPDNPALTQNQRVDYVFTTGFGWEW